MTRLPSKSKPGEEEGIDYSSREVKPPALLLEDLLRAHSTFLLHHASSMSALFVRSRRPKFVNLLGRYWDSFLSTWNVMLHGNPAVSVYGGIKLAGSGELGMGVGEEDRGSGEREVLEGFVGRIDGLVDLVVSKFGGAESEFKEEKDNTESQAETRMASSPSWLGTGAEPKSEDGAIFLGVGALSRKSLRDITHWMEDLYTWGSRAYGVKDNPTSTRKTRKKDVKKRSTSTEMALPSKSPDGSPTRVLQFRPSAARETTTEQSSSLMDVPEGISPTQEASDPLGKKKSKEKRPQLQRGRSSQSSVHSVTTTGGKLVNYLKLGYGTHWSLGGNSSKSSADHGDKATKRDISGPNQPSNPPQALVDGGKHTAPAYDGGSDSSLTPWDDSVGHYLIGLMGDIESDETIATDLDETTADEDVQKGTNYRLLLRTVTVELEREGDARAEADISIDLGTTDNERSMSSKHGGSEHTGTSHTNSYESQDRNKTKKLRIVVYVNKPFIFTFLFENRTNALALRSLYRSLHHQLAPLHRPLLESTNRPPSRPDTGMNSTQQTKTPIYDLVWDSKLLTISSTIPNIPEPFGSGHLETKPSPWSRIEALNTHMQLLNTYTTTRSNRSELEHTCKTSRGWWVVWTRIPDPDAGSVSVSSYTASPVHGARTPQLRHEDSMKTGRSGGSTSTDMASPSMYSGPAHPFLDRDAAPREPIMPKDKEIYVLRRASDYVDGKNSGRFLSTDSMTGESGWGSGTAKLAQGIGVDTKRYIEALLSMNR